MPDSIYKKEYQAVIKRLKDARIEMGLKQGEVANKLGRPQSYVSKIERGERRVDIAEIKLFAKIYQKPTDYFI
jgi:transcriptional regulator with XRE-family HTH domain